MTEKGKVLGDVLREINNLGLKYKFDVTDLGTLFDRLLLFGEAIAMLEELGLGTELTDRHKEACVKAMEEIVKL